MLKNKGGRALAVITGLLGRHMVFKVSQRTAETNRRREER